MNPICNASSSATLQPLPSLFFRHSKQLHGTLPLKSKPPPRPTLRFKWPVPIRACAAASEIDMVKTKQGVYAPKQKKVVILWDLDNKPPRGPPYQAAMALKRVAQRFGDVVDASAYANRHAFVHLPQWVLEQRRDRKQLDILERKGLVTPPSETYVCGVCGRKCKTNLDLKKHFKQLHERERQKKLNRMRSLKGKKRQRFKERHIAGNHKYNEAARSLITPKVGYGLASELRRAGVFVKTVEDKPQAADWALKRQMQHSMSRGIDWLFLVSDDSDFSEMLRRAREANLGTVVVGDWDKALGQHADVWVPWIGVENGEISEKDLVPKSSEVFDDHGLFSSGDFDEGVEIDSRLDSVVDELVVRSSRFNGVRVSAFSEGEEEEDDWVGEAMGEDYLMEDSDDDDDDDEDSEDEDGIF
ncbi:PIN domain-like containing protein [Trema orientale]|uniref:PIN domain-like containing protein n=1 Tax=Trema orientale TaxID=63057 RepID=A0A2P5F8W0_TREOI|nr:PIN domain-like containing protein [Trema orientale]